MRALSIVATFAVVAVVVIAGALLLQQQKAPTTIPAAPTHEDTPPVAAASPTRLTAQRTPAEGDDNDSNAAATGEKTVVDGTVVVTDLDGVEHPKESGALTLWIWTMHLPYRDDTQWIEDMRRPRERVGPVAVTAGRFHVELPPRPRDYRMRVQLDLDGRPAVLDEDEHGGDLYKPAKSGARTLHAHWIGGVRLHVVDEENHRELDEVSIVRRKNPGVRQSTFDADSSALIESFHPGPPAATETLLEHGTSPLIVYPVVFEGEMTISDEWYVRAAGHAWGRIDFNFAGTMERTIDRTLELGAGATLVVDVEGELPRRIEAKTGTPIVPKFRLHQSIKYPIGNLFHSREALIAAEPAALGELRIESLHAGPVVASIEFDGSSDRPIVVAHVDATLAPASTTRVSLVVAPAGAPKPVPLAGTLFVPDGWQIADAHLVIRPEDLVDGTDADQRDLPLSKMEPLSGRPGCFRWNAGSVLPATFAFQIDAAGFAHAVVVDASGDEHVELVLPEPTRLVVRLVDDATGKSALLGGVSWRRDPDETMRWSAAPIALERAADGSHYSGVVPIGAGALRWWNDAEWFSDPATTITTIHPGEPERIVPIHRVVGVVLELSDGSTRVPWSDGFSGRCTIVPVDHSGSVLWQGSWHDGTFRLDVTDAGAYRITIPTIPGFAPVEPFEVNLPEGRLIPRVVYLSRP